MANYEFTVISNYFMVKNPSEVLDVFLRLGYEESYIDEQVETVCLSSYETCWDTDHLVLVTRKDKKVVGVIPSCDIDFYNLEEWLEETGLDYIVDDIEELSISDYIQYQLLDNSYCAIKEVGNEKLRYNIGVADVITKRTTKFFNLDSLIEKYIKELDLEICL